MPNPNLVARVAAGGEIYEDWTDLAITRTYSAWTDDFMFRCAEPGTAKTIKLKPNDRATIFLAGKLVINGFIEVRSSGYNANQHEVMVQGRSKTGDLVDSSAEPAEYKGYDLAAIARAMLKPHGIELVVKDLPPIASKPIRAFRTHYGETVFEAIERLARMRGCFFNADEQGRLVMSSVQKLGPAAELTEGVNILQASAVLRTEASSFGRYQGAGQNTGSDEASGAAVAQVAALGINPDIRPNRKTIVLMEEPGDTQDMQARVDREAAEGLARQVDVTVMVPGWLQPNGELWKPTDHCSIQSPMLFPGVDGRVSLAVRQVVFAQTAPGQTTTTLSLCLPNALQILPGNDATHGPAPDILKGAVEPAKPLVGSA